MHNHASGAGSKLGGTPITHSKRILFSDPTAVAIPLVTLTASPAEPTYFVVTVVNSVASNAATSHTLAVGVTGAAYTDIVAAANLKSAAGTNTAAGSNPIRVITADTTIYAVPTIVGATTAGECHVLVESGPLVG